MSAILQLRLQKEIGEALKIFGAATYTGPPTGAAAQQLFIINLSAAIATAIQEYLVTDVVTIAAPGPVTHLHKLLAP